MIKVQSKPCPRCGERSELEVDEISLMKYQAGMKVQDAFPDLTPGEREVLMTGYHPACWDIDTAPYSIQGV